MATESTADGDLDALIEDLADRPMSEHEMEAAFARIDELLSLTR